MAIQVRIEDAVQAIVSDENVINALTKPVGSQTEEEKKAFSDFQNNMAKEVIIFQNKKNEFISM